MRRFGTQGPVNSKDNYVVARREELSGPSSSPIAAIKRCNRAIQSLDKKTNFGKIVKNSHFSTSICTSTAYERKTHGTNTSRIRSHPL